MAAAGSSASETDRRFMAAAIRLSRRHLGLTSTNPSVGTLIVRDDGAGPVIVGRGVTALGGRPHAEPQALAEAGEAARGATAYVTLEPCAHHGRTPPCAEALVTAGVARVVGGANDPDERVAGRGYAILRAAGIEVTEGVLAERSGRLHGRLPDSLHQEAAGSDSEACGFRRRNDRPKRRGAGQDHRRRLARPGPSDARAIGRDPRRHRHRTCRRSRSYLPPARSRSPLAGAHRARHVGAPARRFEACRHRTRRAGDDRRRCECECRPQAATERAGRHLPRGRGSRGQDRPAGTAGRPRSPRILDRSRRGRRRDGETFSRRGSGRPHRALHRPEHGRRGRSPVTIDAGDRPGGLSA